MRRAAEILFLTCAICFPSLAVDRDFNDIVRLLAGEFRSRPERIPLFGLVNMVTFVARPAGTSHIDLAMFHDIQKHGPVGRNVSGLIEDTVGRGWAPFVRVRSRHKGFEEMVLVYLRTEGRDCRILLTAIERDEATVIQLRLNPEGLQRWIAAPLESAHRNKAVPDE